MPLPVTRPRNGRALTASAVKINVARGDYNRRREMGWQRRALQYLDLVPELSYASRFYARMLKQLRIYPARLDEHGKATAILSGAPVELLNRIQDPGGGRSQIQGNYGTLMFTTGEGYLFGRDLDRPEDERWMFVWASELEITPDLIVWKPTDQEPGIEYPRGRGAEVYRMWIPHPRRSGEPNSPMRSAVEGDVAEELIILTKAVRATAVSRMTNGILLLPQEASPGPLQPVGDEDPENDPYITDWIDHASSQIDNPGTAEASLPFFTWMQGELTQFVKWIQTHDPQTDYMEKDLRKEAVERLARGMDMPVEVLLGLGESNHWAARQIMDDMWRSHGAPIAEHWCDDLCEAYLRPALREEGYEGWRDVVIAYDASQVVVQPDRSKDADAAYDRGQISGVGYRMLKNIPEEFSPSEDEHDEYLAIKLRDPALIDGVQAPPARGPDANPVQVPRDAAEGPPEPGSSGVSRQESQNARILGAAELAVIRCRELAGAKIRSNLRNCPDCLKVADGKPNALVASLVGAEGLALLKSQSAERLVSGGTDGFRALMESWGVDPLITDLLATLIEQHAARTLTAPAVSLPDGILKAVNGHALVDRAA